MTIEITEQQAEIIRQGLGKLPLEYALETFSVFNTQITKQLTANKLKESGVKNGKTN